MKINQCQFCDSKDINRDRYVGRSFIILSFLTLGFIFLGIPWLPVTVECRNCRTMYIAS